MKTWGTLISNRVGIEFGFSWKGWGYTTKEGKKNNIPIGIVYSQECKYITIYIALLFLVITIVVRKGGR